VFGLCTEPQLPITHTISEPKFGLVNSKAYILRSTTVKLLV
jgi:hypothetical protein